MTDTPKFTRRVEDFICGHCGKKVHGNGFTNHCPHCLWSKHVDVNPGDRKSGCGGLMKPTGIEIRHGENYILLQCEKCGHKRPNRAAPEDDVKEIIKVSVANIDELFK